MIFCFLYVLCNPYYLFCCLPEDEPLGTPVSWKWDNFEPTKALLQKYVYNEAAYFHPEVLGKPKDP